MGGYNTGQMKKLIKLLNYGLKICELIKQDYRKKEDFNQSMIC